MRGLERIRCPAVHRLEAKYGPVSSRGAARLRVLAEELRRGPLEFVPEQYALR